MIGYITLGTNDLGRGARFYDAIANELGVARMMETKRFIAWGKPGGVERIHKLALSLGGKDEGAPGSRGEGFYAAYFRDPDGNKLNAFVMG
jgi:catechol 2,3-dioxygenase-like lactoylglutathione lyase family enzyme